MSEFLLCADENAEIPPLAADYYTCATVELMDYILSEQTDERLRVMHYSEEYIETLRKSLLGVDMHALAMRNYVQYTGRSSHLPEKDRRSIGDLWTDAAGMIFQDRLEFFDLWHHPQAVPRPAVPPTLANLQFDVPTRAVIGCFFEDTRPRAHKLRRPRSTITEKPASKR